MKRTLSVGVASALLLGGAVLAAPSAQAAEPTTYAVMLLQPTRGNPDAQAHGINRRGDVVGTSMQDGLSVDGGGAATLWKSRSGRGTSISMNWPGEEAIDISGNGVVVGNYAMVSPRAFWRSGNTTTEIEHDGTTIRAKRISENGRAVLNIEYLNNRLFIATSPTAKVELAPPAASSAPAGAGISDNGRRVAGSATYRNASVPVLWNDGVPTRFALPAGAAHASISAVNDAGVSGGCASISATLTAFRFTANGSATRLPGLSGYTSACASAVSNNGTLAGTAFTRVDGDSRAVVWVDGAARNLNDLVAQRSGYTLLTAEDINASGQIVGTARLANGTTRGYIATPSTASSIYTAPGYHQFNGRLWRTNCEPYSQTSRCTTEIIATTVQVVGGRYQRVTGWTFNNLTYTPSAESLWVGNPLARTGSWTNQGRQWKTECKTPATGRNACRSYIYATVVSATAKPGGGYTYASSNQWLFNNIVHFS